MLRRTFGFLLGTLALAGCAGPQSGPYGRVGQSQSLVPSTAMPQVSAAARSASRVAILLPLSGPMANVGQPMLQAAQLALPAGGAPTLTVKDTGGTAEGAAAAAQSAIAEGAGMILGPLTSAETAAVAPAATQAGVPVLAFTNAGSVAQPGVWTLGITPAQQVRRMVAAAQAQGKTEFAALLPETDFGRSMGDALTEACASAGLNTPTIRYHGSATGSINTAAREVSGYGSRRGPIDAQIKAARAEGTPEGRRRAAELGRSRIPPAPFNALLLADVRDNLQLIAAVLPYYDIDPPGVQIMGPASWSASSSGSGAMQGAWFAAPDNAARAPFEELFSAKYGTPASPLADLAFDAASIARVLAGQGGYSISALTQQAGFAGADGWMVLMPDGKVRRGLALFRIERGGPTMVEPAPASAAIPGS